MAVTQIEDEDKWQKATLAVVGVAKDTSVINSILSKVVNFVERFNSLELMHYEIGLI